MNIFFIYELKSILYIFQILIINRTCSLIAYFASKLKAVQNKYEKLCYAKKYLNLFSDTLLLRCRITVFKCKEKSACGVIINQ